VIAVVLAVLLGLLAVLPAGAQPASSAAPLPIDVTGATRLEYDDRTGVLVAEGAPVVLTRGATVLRAPSIRYDARARVITAAGGVVAEEPGLALSAQTAELRLNDDRIRVSGNVVVRSTRDAVVAELAAPEAEGSLRTRRFVATGGATVTRGEWTVAGQRLDYDDHTRVAVMTGEARARLGEATMTAETITVFIDDDRARADGNVRLHRGDLIGQAPRVDISRKENRAVLLGGARVDRGADRITAETIEVDLEGTRVVARGGSRLTVTPP
jgi:lipopolysaccharide export system protein LptA